MPYLCRQIIQCNRKQRGLLFKFIKQEFHACPVHIVILDNMSSVMQNLDIPIKEHLFLLASIEPWL